MLDSDSVIIRANQLASLPSVAEVELTANRPLVHVVNYSLDFEAFVKLNLSNTLIEPKLATAHRRQMRREKLRQEVCF